MITLHKNEQAGRSMVEMLGVLAIIGVLSIGGISGYSKAMAKFRINKTLDQISMLVMNIRSLFASSLDYTGLDNSLAITMGIIPGEMRGAGSGSIINAFQGDVVIKAGNQGGTNRSFEIEYAGLTQEACVSIATADWGSQAGSGLYSISVNDNTHYADRADGATDGLPLNIGAASGYCGTGPANIKWVYY